MLSNMSLSFSKSKWVVKKKVYDSIFMNLSVKMTDNEKVLRDPWPPMLNYFNGEKTQTWKQVFGARPSAVCWCRESAWEQVEGGGGLVGEGGGSGMKAKLYLQKQKGY